MTSHPPPIWTWVNPLSIAIFFLLLIQVGMGPGVLLQMTCVVLPLTREFKKVDQFDAYVPCAFQGHRKSFPHEPQSKVSFYIYMSLLTICRGFPWVYRCTYICAVRLWGPSEVVSSRTTEQGLFLHLYGSFHNIQGFLWVYRCTFICAVRLGGPSGVVFSRTTEWGLFLHLYASFHNIQGLSMGHHESFPDGPQSKIIFPQIYVSFRNIQVLFCRYIDVYIHVFICVCVCAYVPCEFASERHKDSSPHNIYIYIYIYICIYVYIHTYIHIYLYIWYIYV